jgi:ADP-heptose:LPS heptosyltransferase
VERVLVCRFHSLGDVVLASGIVARLADTGVRVEVATAKGLRPVFEGLPVADIWEPGDLPRLGTFDRVLDLQSNATSRRLLASCGPAVRTRGRSFARRWMVFWGRRAPSFPVPHCAQRYGETAGWGGLDARSLRPRMVVTDRDREEGRALGHAWASTESPCVGLAPGASRAMKRWPAERFDALERDLGARGLRTIRFEEPTRVAEEGEGFVRATLRPLKAILERCKALVTNDSGMMHLAVGLGVPVIAIFGSTVLEFGFGPLGDRDTVLEHDLACRPCAPHGARFCWQGHAGCLRGIAVDDVLAAVLEGARAAGGS